MKPEPCLDPGMRELIRLHFAERLSPADEPRMRTHVASCARCRNAYERHLLYERLTPSQPTSTKSPKSTDRMRRALGLPAPRRWWRIGAAGSTLLVAAAALLLLWSRGPEFVARGQHGRAQLFAYHVEAGRSPSPIGAEIGPHDELAFAYVNPDVRRYLMVWGIDEHSHVYWYYPEWSRPTLDPAAVAIEGGPKLHELAAAVAQPLDGHRLVLHALFLDEPWTVRRVEALLQPGRTMQPPPGATLITIPVAVNGR